MKISRIIVNESKLTPIAREYVSQFKGTKVDVRALLINMLMMIIYGLMNYLLWFDIKPNIIDNLIYLLFTISVLGTTLLAALTIFGGIGMTILKEYSQQKLEAMKKSNFRNQSLINRFVNFSCFIASLIYVALLTRTDHSFIFVFSCVLMISNYVSVKVMKSIFTDALNSLTKEDFETLNSMPEPEKV